MLKRIANQLLGGHIDDVIVVVKNGLEFRVHALTHYFGRFFAVNGVHFAVNELLELPGGVFDLRWVQTLGQKLDILHLIGYRPGVIYDDLLGCLAAQIVEFAQHLVGGAEEDGAAAVGVGEFFRSLQYFAVLLVLRVKEVDVAGGNDGLIELPADIKYAAVIVLKHGFIADDAVIHKEAVVADGLYLKVVIEGGDALELRVARAVHHRAVQLAHAAGRADKYALPVLYKQALGHGRSLVEVFKIRLRHQLIQVFEAGLVLHEQYHMTGFAVVGGFYCPEDLLNIVYSFRALFREHGQEFAHYARDHERVVGGPVVVEFRQAQAV